MPLPPYVKTSECPSCGAGIFVPGAYHEARTIAGRAYRALSPAAPVLDGVPAVMSACKCRWLREAVKGAAAEARADERQD